jgi:methionine sulfoxide reductase heme-binding subunit
VTVRSKMRRIERILKERISWVKALVFGAALIPIVRLAWGAYTDELGANPIEFVTQSTGISTLVFLLVTLAVTPLRKMTGLNELIKLRRMLGLFAFFYACLHLTTYLALDQFFDGAAILADIVKRPYITAGFCGFLLMVPLAATSTRRMIARMGHRWQLLHRLVYVSAAAGVIHFLWLVKADLREPIIYASVLALLLGYRLFLRFNWKWRQNVSWPAMLQKRVRGEG